MQIQLLPLQARLRGELAAGCVVLLASRVRQVLNVHQFSAVGKACFSQLHFKGSLQEIHFETSELDSQSYHLIL